MEKCNEKTVSEFNVWTINTLKNKKKQKHNALMTSFTKQKTWYRYRDGKTKNVIGAFVKMLRSTCNNL